MGGCGNRYGNVVGEIVPMRPPRGVPPGPYLWAGAEARGEARVLSPGKRVFDGFSLEIAVKQWTVVKHDMIGLEIE